MNEYQYRIVSQSKELLEGQQMWENNNFKHEFNWPKY